MTSTRSQARIAGLLYLLLCVAAPFRLIYLPSKLFVPGNPAATAQAVLAHEGLFRAGVLSDLFCGAILVAVVLAFHRLFKAVDADQAALVVLLGGILPAGIYFFNVLNDLAALLLFKGPDFLHAFDQAQREALGMLFLRLHGQEILAAEVLWGLWLFPLAILVYKSRFLPRFLAVWLVLNGLAYLALSVIGILWPHREAFASQIAFPAQLGEIALMLWLVICGAKETSPRAATAF